MLALVLVSLVLVLALALVLARRGGLWEQLGVPYEPGLPIFGNYFPLITQKASIHEIYRQIYRNNDGKSFVGIHKFRRPALLVRDVELSRNILTRDFSSFHDNTFDINPKLDPLLSLNPFFLKGEKWKTIRTQLLPAFTSGRLKNLLQPISEIADELVAYCRAESPAALPDGLDVKEVAAKFTTEVVSSVAFGLRANSFRDPDAEIRRMGRRLIQPDSWNTFLITVSIVVPVLQNILRISFMPQVVDRFFRKIIGEAVKHREEKGITRNDFLQLLIGLKQKAQQQGDNSYGDLEITAHALTFFTDGFETSSVALSFLLHDLSGSPEAQRRLRADLAQLRADDHEGVLQLPFLHACLMESMRLHPPLGFMEKICTADYKLQHSQGEVTLPKDMHVVLPVSAWHSDPTLFSDPDVFRPERFLEDEGGDAAGGGPKGAFLPFGDGPRQCIGLRFAQTQVKMGAAALVRAFELKRTPRSPSDPVRQDPKNFLTGALGGLWVHFEPLAKAA